MAEETMVFITRCRKFFGLHEGQKLSEFADEVKQLTEQDKVELVEMFNEAGMPTVLKRSDIP